MSDLISVIVPIYNVGKYLRTCIGSILVQTHRNLQIILVDDGSTDGSGGICDEYREKDGRIQVIHRKNGGLVKARKTGLAAAKGDYIGFVDGDDYIEKEMYERLLEILKGTAADFVHAGFFKNDETQTRGTGAYTELELNKENRISVMTGLLFNLDQGQIMSPCLCFKLFRRQIIIDAYAEVPDDQSYGEDLISLCMALSLSCRITIINEAYYHYIVRDDSIMNHVNHSILVREERLRRCMERLTDKLGISDGVKDALELYWLTGLLDDLKKIAPACIRIFNCAFISRLCGRKVILYGAGAVGCDYYSQIRMFENIELAAWVDRNASGIVNPYCTVSPVTIMAGMEYDYIVIAVLTEPQAAVIRQDLIQSGIEDGKIVWERPRLTSVIAMEG